MIIKILYNNEKLSSGELKKQLDQSLLNHGYNKTVPDTYWGRLRQMASSSNSKQSKYAIQPILTRYEEILEGNIRGDTVSYGLTETTRIRRELQLPILKSESTIEQAYRLLLYYIVFFYNKTIKFSDENEYKVFLENQWINKNELEYQGKSIINDKDNSSFESTIWIHTQSEIKFIHKHYLKGSREGNYEYYCILPGISASDFITIKQPGLVYQQLEFTKDKLTQYFQLLEKGNLIKKLKSYQLILDEERYTIVDDLLQIILRECWTLYSHVSMYLIYKWQVISRPTYEEKVWYKHLWGKNRSIKWFRECSSIRRDYQKENKKQIVKETQDMIDWQKSEIIKTFELIKKKYAKTLNDYSYFINPLLNVLYPQFLRKDFSK